jgi:hypothetical protein
MPQPPQLLGSLSAMQAHTPLVSQHSLVPATHASLHAPQFILLCAVGTPLQQSAPVTPQPPQSLGLLSRSTQLAPQQ